MNAMGHKSQATVALPIILLGANFVNHTNYSNSVSVATNEFMMTFIQSDFIIVVASIVAFFIGSFIVDTIDFKILKHFASNPNDHTTFHRQITHGILTHTILTFVAFYMFFTTNNPYYYVAIFGMFGIWVHLIGDMITGSIPLFFSASYTSKFRRFGINKIMPKFIRPLFNKVLPNLADTKIVILGMYISSFALFTYLNGAELIIKPLLG